MLCLAILAAPVGRALLPQVGNPPESGCEAWIEGRRCRAGSMPERFIVADSAACLVKWASVGEDGCCRQSWGCRCCVGDGAGGKANSNWSLYAVGTAKQAAA